LFVPFVLYLLASRIVFFVPARIMFSLRLLNFSIRIMFHLEMVELLAAVTEFQDLERESSWHWCRLLKIIGGEGSQYIGGKGWQ